jgi:DNA primase
MDVIDEIKNRLDIVDVVSSYLRLQKAGSNYRALCPFHSEKKPSFFVSPKLQIFKCFGCGKSGDIFKFVMEIERVDFKEALKILAEKAGVQLSTEKESEDFGEKSRFFKICELSAKFFERQLESKTGKKVIDYLLGRKINMESIQKWRLGWAPDTKSSLIDFLKMKGFSIDEIEKAGLCFKKENGEILDFFRGRIIFPIFDLNSRVIGFSGRIFEKEGPKYINCRNTLLYDKSRTIYGLDKAKKEIKNKDFCLIMEGYTDVILAHQEGFQNAVSVSGTAISEWQLQILKRFTSNLFLCFDADFAGDQATKRAIDLAIQKDFQVKVVLLEEGKDPADIISENKEVFEKVIKEAISIMEFYFKNFSSQYDKNTVEGKREIARRFLIEVKKLPNEIEKEFWVNFLSQEISVSKESLLKEMQKIKIEDDFFGKEREEIVFKNEKTKREILEERLLTLILKLPQNLVLIDNEKIEYFSPEIKEIFKRLKEDLKFDPKNLSEKAKELFFEASVKSEIPELNINKDETTKEINFCLREISKDFIKEKLAKISESIKEAEKNKNQKKVKEFLNELKTWTEKLSKI